MKVIFIKLKPFLLIFLTQFSFAAENVQIRVIDVGAGLCAVIKMPNNMYMIYDAGNYVGGGREAFESVAEIIPANSTIELMVLSHSDSDHLGAVDEICEAYKVKRIIRSGFTRTSETWQRANEAIRAEVVNDGCIDINLRNVEFPPGATYRFGDVFVTMVCGFHKPPDNWDLRSVSEYRNAGSVVIRLQYNGGSVLFCGDTVGRHIGNSDTVCLAAEKYMVDNAAVIDIDSDVIVAPHHGADNGSSTKFINAVSPEHVIFSAGHNHEHPRRATAQRYLNNGVKIENIFRTDRGDNEGEKEWRHLNTNQKDPIGDDDVDIFIDENGMDF